MRRKRKERYLLVDAILLEAFALLLEAALLLFDLSSRFIDPLPLLLFFLLPPRAFETETLLLHALALLKKITTKSKK